MNDELVMLLFTIIGIPILLLMLYFICIMHDKCPRCWNKMEVHEEFSNALYCRGCKYLKMPGQ